MTTLLEESLTWRPREPHGLSDIWRPRIEWAHRLFQKNGDIRFRGGEIGNRFGFALCLHLDWNTGLHILLGWPSIWLKLGIKEKADFDINSKSRAYGFSFSDGNTLHLYWGRASKIFWWPFRPHCIRSEYLRADGTWAEIPLRRKWGSPEDKAFTAEREATEAVYVEDWFYQTRWCERQSGKARIKVSRGFILPFALSWLSFLARERRYIDITFNREVGTEAGSWKGGCVGCSYQMRKGESPPETFKRMMNERTFDR